MLGTVMTEVGAIMFAAALTCHFDKVDVEDTKCTAALIQS